MNSLHQTNWIFIVLLISGYFFIAALFLMLFTRRGYENNEANSEEKEHLLSNKNEEDESHNLCKNTDFNKENTNEQKFNNDILISFENNYINDITDSINIET